VIKSRSALYLSDPRIGGRERFVDRFLHMIKNEQPNRSNDDGGKASNKKSLHGAPFSDIASGYIANNQMGRNGERAGFMESLEIRC
jgi:hypothetical protein